MSAESPLASKGGGATRGLTDAEFERLYGREEQCLAAWMKARQDAGMPCPRCGNPRSYVCDRRVGCTRCDTRWSITSGSVMADTKLPPTTWFRAMHLMSSNRQCIPAVEPGRRLGVGYPTAWYLHKRLRHAMTEESNCCQLGAPAEGGWTPIVEADDVYRGGKRNEGSGTRGKTRVIAAAERHPSGRMGAVAMQVVSGVSNAEALKATCKLFSPKHLPDYLGAFRWTTNHRRNMRGMVSAPRSAAASASRITRRSVYA